MIIWTMETYIYYYQDHLEKELSRWDSYLLMKTMRLNPNILTTLLCSTLLIKDYTNLFHPILWKLSLE